MIHSYEAQLYLELEWTRIQRDGTRITDTQQEWFGSVSALMLVTSTRSLTLFTDSIDGQIYFLSSSQEIDSCID